MKRRSFIAGLGSAAAWPMIASGQQVPHRIGVLMPTTESDPIERSWLAAFVEELARLGWVNGRTIAIDYRWGGGDVAKYRIFAKELVDLRPDALLVAGTPAVAPALEATHSIPIVFTLVGDPVGSGFVESLSRPGGNITGFIPIEPLTASKWLELLRAAAPQVRQIAFLYNPDTASYAGAFFRHAEAAAAAYAVNLIAAPVHNDMEVENVLGMLAQEPKAGLSCCQRRLRSCIASGSSRKPPVTTCPRSTVIPRSSNPAPLSPILTTIVPTSGLRRGTSIAFSRERSRATLRCRRPPGSN